LDEVDALRKFLGDRKMTKTMYLERGLALDILEDNLFQEMVSRQWKTYGQTDCVQLDLGSYFLTFLISFSKDGTATQSKLQLKINKLKLKFSCL